MGESTSTDGPVAASGPADSPTAEAFGRVRVVSHTWIPVSDGTRLAARLWLPEGAEQEPVPAILEYIPYRKNDLEAAEDASRYSYFAAHGYAGIRVDLRGSGDSEGVLFDEYLAQEQDDAVDVIDWIAAQPWCNGRVGMIGYSWGGFSTLQTAARRPAALGAAIAMMAADDRYADDVHFIGGSLLANCGPGWATFMLAHLAMPPNPEVVGPDWRRLWMQRLQGSRPMIEPWLTHQRRDAYWRHGSVCEDFSAIRCPVYAVGGWADGYRDAVLHLVERLEAPCKGLIGPWYHGYPQEQGPQAIGFLQECLRWWDHWLKDVDNGIMEEPRLRLWLQDPVEPRTLYAERPGRWIAEREWPSQDARTMSLALNRGTLDQNAEPEDRMDHTGSQAIGLDGGFWCAFGYPGDWAPDQRADEGRSLTFTSRPLESPLDLVGTPLLRLTVASDKPMAQLAVRLSSVAPSGASTLLTRGFLNLTHRDSHEMPRAMVPGEPCAVVVPLQSIAEAVPAGHRLRLAISSTYWPWIWPSPEPVRLTVTIGQSSTLELPVRPGRDDDALLAAFAAPEAGPRLRCEDLTPSPGRRYNRADLAADTYEQVHEFFDSHLRFDDGLEIESSGPDTYTIVEGDPLSAKIVSERHRRLSRGPWSVRVDATSVMTADERDFRVSTTLVAHEGDERVYSNEWTFVIPRDHV